MQRGLEGRRIALFAEPGSDAAEIRKELIAAGAEISELPGDSQGSDDRWHSGMYAALVVVGDADARTERHPNIAQMIREFLVSEKPVATFQADAEALQLDESLLAVRGGDDARAFAREVATVLADRLDEREVDEMSDLSFPASDPPAANPGTTGHVSPERDARP
jgi:hypothetical protein